MEALGKKDSKTHGNRHVRPCSQVFANRVPKYWPAAPTFIGANAKMVLIHDVVDFMDGVKAWRVRIVLVTGLVRNKRQIQVRTGMCLDPSAS